MRDPRIILRREILKQIRHYFQMIEQHAKGPYIQYRNAWEASCQAEALIELLEIHDCGSISGFDKGQQAFFEGKTLTLTERYWWLKRK